MNKKKLKRHGYYLSEGGVLYPKKKGGVTEHAGYKKKEGLEGAARTKKPRRGVGPYI